VIYVGRYYQHYKGGRYEVLYLGTHTETKESLVIYRSLEYGTVWARPVSSWLEPVNTGTERFSLIS